MAWLRAVEKSFDYEPRFLYAERHGVATGVMPLFLVSNWVMGRCLISIPFADYGGVCAADRESADALIEAAKQIAISEKVDFLELRHRTCELRADFYSKSLYVGFTSELGTNPEAMLAKLPRDTRYMIRKGEKAGLELRAGVEQMDSFYELFAANWRRFGTPVLSRQWLQTLATEFQDTIDLKLAYHEGKAVAGVLSFVFGDTVFPHYAGASADANRLAANNFIYWELMKDAVYKGLRRFDFGRSKRGTGAYQFKSSWNMQADTLDYQVFLVRRKDAPNFSPTNPKFEMAARMWSKLPLPATTWLGPKVVRWFP
jgi:FemAB-related protein (PEP-CTERM system-associated)